MPSWNDVLKELTTPSLGPSLDGIRRKHLLNLFEYTQRNTIAYYSGWLQKPGAQGASISDNDKNGFMTTIHKLDRSKGLDLILHTLGGDIAATESIVDYLYRMFGTDIRVIIPQLAMSAGTMIACAAKEIVLGKQSSIGPIDPQLGGIPVHGVIEEIKRAFEETRSDPSRINIWSIIISKYHPTFVGECENAIQLSDEIVSNWLENCMFKDDADRTSKAQKILLALNNHSDTKSHSRHLSIDKAKEFGLKVIDLESDDRLQDLVLTVHHCYMHTIANSPAIKIIENHIGEAMFINALPGAQQ